MVIFMKKIFENKYGITLIELIITMAILAIVIQVVYSVFFVGIKSFNVSKNVGFTQQEARTAITFITNEVKSAKRVYIQNPLFFMDDGQPDSTLNYPFYALNINGDNQLVITTYKDQDDFSEKRIFSGIDSVLFETILDEGSGSIDNNSIKINVISKEGFGSNAVTKKYNAIIRFENARFTGVVKYKTDIDGNIIIPEDPITSIYYTKYE